MIAGTASAANKDGAAAAAVAAEQALQASGAASASMAVVFAGVRHERDDYAGVLRAVEQALPGAAVVGCSTTGVLTAYDELEEPASVGVLAIAAPPAELPTPISIRGLRADARAAGMRVAERALDLLGGAVQGGALALMIDPSELDAAAFVSGLRAVAPELVVVGAGAAGGSRGPRLFAEGDVLQDAAVGLVFGPALRPTFGLTQGCQAMSDPMTITSADGNLILELEGRAPLEVLQDVFSDPRNAGVGAMAGHVLAGIGEPAADGRADYIVRPFAISEDNADALAISEVVHTGQTLRLTLRDAIGAREDMKRMLEEKHQETAAHAPAFALYFNCAGRGSALYGRPGLDPELIRRAFGDLQLIGMESAFEIAPVCGRPRVHMFTGVLLLAG